VQHAAPQLGKIVAARNALSLSGNLDPRRLGAANGVRKEAS